MCVNWGSNSWQNFGNVRELSLVLALSAFLFFSFVFVVALYCLSWKFMLSYAVQKCVEKNTLGYFEECHTVGVVVLFRIGVLVVVLFRIGLLVVLLQGGKYVRSGSRSFIIFVFHLDRRVVYFHSFKLSYPGLMWWLGYGWLWPIN